MIYIWRILDTFFRFDAWYHYLHISRIADDIFYGKVKGAMWQIGSSLQSTTSVCGSVPMGLVVKLYGDQKAQRHLPSSVHTMASWLKKTWGIKETTKVGWFQVLTLSILVSTAFTFLSVAFFDWGRETRTAWHDPSGCLTLERKGLELGESWIWTRHSVLQASGCNGHSGTLWNWSAFTSWSHLKNLINLFDSIFDK